MEKKNTHTQLSYGYLDLCKKTNPYPLGDNQMNICQSRHAIPTCN